MKQGKSGKSLEAYFSLLLARSKLSRRIPISELVALLSGRGMSLVLIFLCLPFCQPLQIPGVAIPFGLMCSLIGIRIALGKGIWLPKRILKKSLSSSLIGKIASKGITVAKKINRFIHPRLMWVCANRIMNIFNGLLIFVMGIFLALPIPIPLSNIVAAWSIFFVGIGILEEDGLFVLLGYGISILSLVFLGVVLFSVHAAIT
jgi:hypothetical protein